MDQAQAFRTDLLPRKCDVLRHIWHIGNGKVTRDAINKTTKDLIEIWESADCPPKSRSNVTQQINVLLKEYKEPKELRESRASNKVVARKRAKNESSEAEEDEGEVKKTGSLKGTRKTHKQKAMNITSFREFARMNWMENEGHELFDILGVEKLEEKDKLSKRVKKIPDRYDWEFYEDQKSKREKKINMRMNDDYIQEKKEEQETLMRKKRRVELAYRNEAMSSGRSTICQEQEDNDSTEEEDLCNDPFSLVSVSIHQDISEETCNKSVKTRNESSLNIEKSKTSTISRATQTEITEDLFPQLDTKIPSKSKNKEAVLISPTILETIVECETVNRCSLDSAIRCIQTVANRVFKQQWKLPLSMDEEYLRDTKLLKKLEAMMEATDKQMNQDVIELIDGL